MQKIKRPANFNYLAFIASSLILLSLAIFSLIWLQKQKKAEDLIAHTYEVKLQIEKAFGLLLEAESGQRGYLLHSDSSFLNNISHAEGLLDKGLSRLDSMIADNPVQVKNLRTLQALVYARIVRLHILLDSSTSNNFTITHFNSPGKKIMDSIHQQIMIMQEEENGLLEQRTFFRKIENDRVIAFIILFSIIAFVILMWSYFKIRNENVLRLRAQLEINNQNEKLERKNRDLTTFTNIASHDLKEPLRKIQMFTNLITDSNPEYLTHKSFDYLQKIAQQSNRMQALIDSVLEYAQTDEADYGFQQTDLNEIAKLAIEDLSEIINEKNAEVVIGKLPIIYCSPTQMEQLFVNLIENGIKYSRTDITPQIEINAVRTKDSWKMDFRDNGIGFDETYGEKIFEVFQRLHSADAYSGTGIGLAICKKIVENHRGTIIAKSVSGKGSVFSIILPADESQKQGIANR